MKQVLAIAKNTFLQTVRQPLYGIIVLTTLAGLALAPSLTGWTLDDDDKMLRDIGLSTLLIQGLFLACFTASFVFHTEIEDKTILASAAKPVPRPIFVFGKYLGVLSALLAAHYLAGIALFMCLRHGVLQMASQSVDMTVIVFGPIVMFLIVIFAGIANFAFEWRFLPTVVTLAIPLGTLSTAVLMVVDRDWHVAGHEVTQTMDNLPVELEAPGILKGIIEFRPNKGSGQLEGHAGLIVRDTWKGPITDSERAYLLSLSDSYEWQRDVDYLIRESRKRLDGVEVFKAGVLIFGAIMILAGIAVAVSTRLGPVLTFVICILATCAGLTVDYYLLPIMESGHSWASWVYALLPNLQSFWMVDALTEERTIPVRYLVSAFGYAALYTLAVLAIASSMFETREVG